MSQITDKQTVVNYILNEPRIVSGEKKEEGLNQWLQKHGDSKSTYSFLIWRFGTNPNTGNPFRDDYPAQMNFQSQSWKWFADVVSKK